LNRNANTNVARQVKNPKKETFFILNFLISGSLLNDISTMLSFTFNNSFDFYCFKASKIKKYLIEIFARYQLEKQNLIEKNFIASKIL